MRRTWYSTWIVVSTLLNLLAPAGVGAIGPPTDAVPACRQALSAWFTGPPAADITVKTGLPSWFANGLQHPSTSIQHPVSIILPAWFATSDQQPPTSSHHTIHPDAVTVTGPDGPINNCDVVTFTIIATNDAVTTTSVIITSTMPADFEPTQHVFDVDEVGPNETITRYAVFSSTCSAVSGQNVTIVSQDNYDNITRYTDFSVNPGAITVRKEPAVVPAAVGEVITWTVIVENTGYGRVDNVLVTDTLGSGLTFEAGQTSAYTPSLAQGQTLTFPVSARVDACTRLDNEVVAAWGCSTGQCQQLQAKASVDLQLKTPYLDYTSPPFNVDYCVGSEIFTITVNNSGEGTAHDVLLTTDMSPLSVTVLSPGAAYTPGVGFTLPDITGTTGTPTEYELICQLTISDPCGLETTGGGFEFQLEFEDDCGNPYVLPVRRESWTLVGDVPSLSISKEDMPGEIYLGDAVSPTIVVNAANLNGPLVVTDTLPPGWTVVDPDDGNVFTVTAQVYITWTVSGTTTTVLTPVIRSPVIALTDTAACDYCGQLAINTVEVRGTDCQNCEHSAQDTASTYIQCQDNLTSRNKQVAPVAAETCTGFVYTNTYVFASTFNITPTWAGLVFTDDLPYQTYVTGSASIWLHDGQSCAAVFSETVSSGMLVLTNISPTCSITMPGTTMIINYNTVITEPAGCDDLAFYDWSYLDLGVIGNEYCADDGILEEGVFATVDAPQMAVGVLGAPANVEPCAQYTLTLTLDRLDDAPAYDMALRFNTTDYAVVRVLGFGGATPVFTHTGPLSYTWFYNDNFATATTATVHLFVQRYCDATGPIDVEAWYEGLCEDDEDYFEDCYISGGANPPPLEPSLIIAKYPELHWANSDTVTWTLTLINSGAGVAHDIILTDTLGSGLRYLASTITTTRGSVAGVVPVVNGGLITWTLEEVPSGAQVTIRLAAEVIACDDLTNAFSGYQFCQDQTCVPAGPMTSVVELPETILLNTNIGVTPIEVCTTGTVTITVKNAGLMSVYSATVQDILPADLLYVLGSTEYSTDTIIWHPGPNPAISGQTLTWGPTSGMGLGNLLARLYPNDTVYIHYIARADCDYRGGLLRIHTGYFDVCGVPHETNESTYALEASRANLTIVKQGQNLSTGGSLTDLVLAEPGDSVLWVITVANGTPAGTAYQVLVTDTLPWNANFVTATPPVIGPDASGTLTWSVGTLPSGNSRVLTISTVISTPNGCDPDDSVNVAAARWGCPTGCLAPWQFDQATLRTRPVFTDTGIQTNIPPATLHQCGGVLTITLNNEGPPAYNVTLTDTIPSGFVYSDTIYASTTPSGTVDLGRTVVYTWGVLPTGVTIVVFEVVNSAGSGGCAIPHGANVIAMTYDDDIPDCFTTGPYSATSTTDINVVGPTLTVDKEPETMTAQVGERVTWTLTVQNVGQGAAYNVAVTDAVASSFSGVTATNGSDGSPPVVVGNVITWTPNPIPSGGTWTAQASAVLINTGVNRNVITATASCDTGCLATTGSDIAYVTLLQQFDKGPSIQTGTIGSLMVFTLTATLPDQDALYEGLTLTDTLPTGLGYVSSVLTYTYDGDGNSGGPYTAISTTPTVTPGWLGSGDVVWALGDMTGTVQVDGVLTAVIQNIPSNQSSVRRTNALRMTYTDDGQGYEYSDTADVDILEPLLHIGKSYVTPYGCEATLFQDNFNDGDASGWDEQLSGWSVVDGVYQNAGNGSNRRSFAGDFTWTDYSFSAMLRSTDDDHIGLLFRVQSINNATYYRFRWRASGSGWQRWLERVESNSVTAVLGSDTVPYQEGRWYHVEIRAEGSRLRVFVDGELIFDVTDTTFASGRIGVYSYYNDVSYFDDILVTRLNNMACYVGANDLVTYTIPISNQARIPGYDLVITDSIPAGMSLLTYTIASDDPTASVVAEPAPIPGATGILTWAVDHLTPTVPFDPLNHTGLTLTVVLRVADGITANVTLPNQASLAYDNWEAETQPLGIDRDYSGGSHSAAARTVNGAILKTVAPPTATLGDVVTYVIAVPATPITATLYAVIVTDQLDARLQLHTVTDGPDGTAVVSGNAFTVTYPSIPHGQQRFITVTAVLSDPLGALAGDVVTNVALLSHTTGTTASNQVAFTVTEPALTLVKASEPPTTSTVEAGDSVTYTVRITNASGFVVSAAYELAFTDTLPVGMRGATPALLAVTLNGTPVSASDYVTGYNGATGVFTVTFTPAFSIPVGSVLLIQYVATVDADVPAAVDLTNQAETTWSSLPGPVPGDRDYGPISDTTTVHTPLAVGLHKEAEPPTVTVGSQVVFTVALPVPPIGAVLHNVVFTDVVDGRLRIESVSPNASFGGQVVTASFTTIPTYTQELIVITATVRDLPTVTEGALITDVATFDYTNNPRGPIGSNVVTVTVAEPEVTLDKSVDVPRDPLGAGDVVTYTLALFNTGTWPAYDLVITDSLPAGLSFVATVGFVVTDPATATLGGDYPVWTVSQLNVGGYVYITFTAQVAWDISAGLTLTNSAWGAYDNWPGEQPDERDYDIPTDTVPVDTGYPLLDLTKAASPVPATAGEPLTFALTVTNTGIVSATGVVITDTVPGNTIYQSCGPLPCGESGGVVSWTLGVLDIGIPRVVSMVVLVNADASGQVVNTGWVTCSEGVTDTDTVTVPLGTRADLAVVKADDPDPVIVGTLLTYTLVATNYGPSVARGVQVTDTLPPEVAFVSATPLQTSGPNPLVWNLGDLVVGEVRRITVTVRVLVTTTDVFTNAVIVGSDTPDDNPDNNQDEEPTTPLVPGLDMTKTVEPGRAARHQPFTYTIRITNTGQVILDPLVLTDTLPPDFYYIAGSGVPADPDVIAEPTLAWQNLGPLAPGASITIRFAVTATPDITGTYWNVAVVEGHHPGGVITDTDDAPISIIDPAVVVDKQVAAVDLDNVQPNYVTFTIAITNVGPSTIDVLPLLDQYDPYYLSFTDATPYPEEDADDGILTWYDLTGPAPNGFNRNLSPGESFVVTATFRVVHDITTTINTAIISDVVDIYENRANDDEDDAIVSDVPTAVELIYFRVGDVTGHQVRLEWATAVEMDNFGFRLYRAPEADRSRATPLDFVPSQAQGGGATYDYTDTVPADRLWWYWLADVDSAFLETFHGPVRAVVGAAALPYRVYLPLVMR